MQDFAEACAPVESTDTGSVHAEPEEGIALCLSGGGYRAMLFHLGTLWRLNELGYLSKLDRISSVSGGSITAAMLALNWSKLDFSSEVAPQFDTDVVHPIRRLASRTLDVPCILLGLILPGSIGDRLAGAYRRQLFGSATLQSLPDRPRFVLNTTNVQSGALWRFMKPYMRDYKVGEVKNPNIPLSVAVAASSAFPPVLSPVCLKLNAAQYTPRQNEPLHSEPYTTNVVLSDGGVYDNLGLETAWKRYRTILVSDAGGFMPPQEKPKWDWIQHSIRILGLIDNQVRSLRKRQLLFSFKQGSRKGAYWGIRTDITKYGVADALPCPYGSTLALANVKTRLKRLDAGLQERLINWGYAICDAAMRSHVDKSLRPPVAFPYPSSGV